MSKGLRTGLPIGLTTGATLYTIQKIKSYDYDVHKDLTPVGPCVEAWAQRTLAGTQGEAASIRIMGSSGPPGVPIAACNPHTILLDLNTLSEILRRLKVSISSEGSFVYSFNDRELDQMGAFLTFALVHEKGHLFHEDMSYTQTPTCIAMGNVTVLAAAYARNCLKAKPYKMPSTLRGKALFLMASAGAGIAKFVMGTLAGMSMHCIWNRRKEARADRFACEFITSPAILRGAADCFHDQSIHQIFNALPVIRKSDGTYDDKARLVRFQGWSPLMQKIFIRWAGFRSDAMHPHALDRAKRLRAAAARLESQTSAVPK